MPGAMITIKIATAPALLAVAATHDQTAIEIAFGPNTAAKSDGLPIPDVRKPTEADPVPPVATTIRVETPSSSLETTNRAINETSRKSIDTTHKKIAHRRWQNSNAKLIADSPPRRHAKAKPEKTSADNDHGKQRATCSNADRTPSVVCEGIGPVATLQVVGPLTCRSIPRTVTAHTQSRRLPNGARRSDSRQISCRGYDEARPCGSRHAYQKVTDWYLLAPPT
jgi:hypothetical protein